MDVQPKLVPDFDISLRVLQSLKNASAAIYQAYDPKLLSSAAQDAARAMSHVAQISQAVYAENGAKLSSVMSDCLRDAIRVPDLKKCLKPILDTLEAGRIVESYSNQLRDAINAAIQATSDYLDFEPMPDADTAEFVEVPNDFYDAADTALESARNVIPDIEIPIYIENQVQSRPKQIPKEDAWNLKNFILNLVILLISLLSLVLGEVHSNSEAAQIDRIIEIEEQQLNEECAQTELLQQILDTLQGLNNELDIHDDSISHIEDSTQALAESADLPLESGNGHQQTDNAD